MPPDVATLELSHEFCQARIVVQPVVVWRPVLRQQINSRPRATVIQMVFDPLFDIAELKWHDGRNEHQPCLLCVRERCSAAAVAPQLSNLDA